MDTHPQRNGGLVQAMMDLSGLSLPSREEERPIGQ